MLRTWTSITTTTTSSSFLLLPRCFHLRLCLTTQEQMDPWAGIRQMFEQPSPEGSMLMLSVSWNEIKLADPISPSFEMFGEIHFKEGSKPAKPPQPFPPLSSAPARRPWIMEGDNDTMEGDGGREPGDDDEEKNSGEVGDEAVDCHTISPENSETICTEEFDFETLYEDATKGSSQRRKEQGDDNALPITYTRSRSDSVLTCREGFPPPISTIGRGVKPWVYLKSFRKDGRFVLKKMKVPTQQRLEATRENGRLMLHLANPKNNEGNGKDADQEEEEERPPLMDLVKETRAW